MSDRYSARYPKDRSKMTYKNDQSGNAVPLELEKCMFDKVYFLIDDKTGRVYKTPRTNKVAAHSLASARHMLSNQKMDNDLELYIVELDISSSKMRVVDNK